MKKWTSIEIAELKNLVNSKWSDGKIALRLGRSVNSITCKRQKLNINRLIICPDCGKIIKITKPGKRIRCSECSEKRTINIKKQICKNWECYNEKHRSNLRDNLRYSGLREFIIKRDNYHCINCGMTREDHKNKWNCDLTVSRILGPGRNSKLKNNNPDNLITLCLSCQGKHDVKKRIQDWLMCGQSLKNWYKIINDNKNKSITQRLNEGLRPKRLKNNMVVWI